jgi:hypothetical protein
MSSLPQRALVVAISLGLVASGLGCGGVTAPSPVQVTEKFTGTLNPHSLDFKTFTVNYTYNPTEIDVTINSLATVANQTPVTGITIGVAIGQLSAQNTCVEQVFTRAANIGQAYPESATAGQYCAQVSDCPPNTVGCTSNLTEPVTYTMTVVHY